jgi:hypothetical protein
MDQPNFGRLVNVERAGWLSLADVDGSRPTALVIGTGCLPANSLPTKLAAPLAMTSYPSNVMHRDR